MVAQIGVKLNKDMHDVTDKEILQYGALIVIREAGWERRPPSSGRWPKDSKEEEEKEREWDMNHEKGYSHVEPGDYYSERNEPISFILTGNKMFSILRQLGVIPRTWGPNQEKNEKELLIKYVRLKHPEVSIEKIIEKIDSLDRGEFRKFYNIYIPEKVRFKH